MTVDGTAKVIAKRDKTNESVIIWNDNPNDFSVIKGYNDIIEVGDEFYWTASKETGWKRKIQCKIEKEF